MTGPVVRPIASDLKAELTQQHVRPVHLVAINFDGTWFYVTDELEQSYSGNTYTAAGVRMGQFAWTQEGEQTGTLFLMNENNIASALVLNTGIADRAIKIWKRYRKADGSLTTPELVVTGVGDEVDIQPDEVAVKVVTSRSRSLFAPRKYYKAANGFRYLPVPGTVITLKNERFVLEK